MNDQDIGRFKALLIRAIADAAHQRDGFMYGEMFHSLSKEKSLLPNTKTQFFTGEQKCFLGMIIFGLVIALGLLYSLST